MTLHHHYINDFIYPTDNIPDHRSRRFGCCPCLMAVRAFASLQQKKPHLSCNSDTAKRKMNRC